MAGIGNSHWRPSQIEDYIYELINVPDFLVSSSEYTKDVIPTIQEYLNMCAVQYNIIEDSYPNMSGASVSICWIEMTFLHHIVLNIRY